MADLRTIVVSNVSDEAKESELRVFFRFHGDIVNVQYENADRSKVLIEYSNADEATGALLFDNTSFHGNILRVDMYDKPQIPSAPDVEPVLETSPVGVEEEEEAEEDEEPQFESPKHGEGEAASLFARSTGSQPSEPVSSPVTSTAKISSNGPFDGDADDATVSKITLFSPFDKHNGVLVVLGYLVYLCVGTII
eukprot:TRINITY_DN7695_c0_g1_i10.p1 TRINITY_DN7695_c0_g1~~TRINITY_DN7695_c0_g1_i10.p1  ORF type:complete len:194 (+),score=64.45 TRINITY_DN7695_c0_g1_i10:190-771(+)